MKRFGYAKKSSSVHPKYALLASFDISFSLLTMPLIFNSLLVELLQWRSIGGQLFSVSGSRFASVSYDIWQTTGDQTKKSILFDWKIAATIRKEEMEQKHEMADMDIIRSWMAVNCSPLDRTIHLRLKKKSFIWSASFKLESNKWLSFPKY